MGYGGKKNPALEVSSELRERVTELYGSDSERGEKERERRDGIPKRIGLGNLPAYRVKQNPMASIGKKRNSIGVMAKKSGAGVEMTGPMGNVYV